MKCFKMIPRRYAEDLVARGNVKITTLFTCQKAEGIAGVGRSDPEEGEVFHDMTIPASSLENQVFSRSLDVYGRPWMAPPGWAGPISFFIYEATAGAAKYRLTDTYLIYSTNWNKKAGASNRAR
jgi:hypothetical protein